MHLHVPATEAQIKALAQIRNLAAATLDKHEARKRDGYCGAASLDPMADAIRSIDRDDADDVLKIIEGMARLNRSDT